MAADRLLAAGARLVLIGSPVSGYEEYFNECKKLGGGFTTFIPTMRHEDPLLRSAYAACDLFVLQGWFETPGLVAMEAALAGAQDVTVKTDSELLARQINGQYKVRDSHLKLFHDLAQHASQAFASVTVVHIPREQNTVADALAARAAAEGVRFAASL